MFGHMYYLPANASRLLAITWAPGIAMYWFGDKLVTIAWENNESIYQNTDMTGIKSMCVLYLLSEAVEANL